MVAALLALCTLFVPVLPTTAPPAAQIAGHCDEAWLDYQPPVPGPIVDRFRVHDGPFGPGNRGLEYTTTPGEAVGAVAEGVVSFAGPVAGALWVTVTHPDGLRSSYGPLAELLVARSQLVAGGEPVGTAGELLHLGIRRGEDYVDPEPLLSGSFAVRLVPAARFEDYLNGGSCGGVS